MATIPEVKIRLTVENGNVKANIDQASNALKGLGAAGSKLGGVSTQLDQIAEATQRLASATEAVQNFGAAFLGFEGLKALVMGAINTNVELQQMQYTLEAATGSTIAAEAEMSFLLKTANRLGISLESIAHNYGTYAVAAKTAGLSTAEMRDLFTSMSEAATVFHLSQEQVDRAMRAIDQSMGMGSFRSEELRMQLGTAIPGAFEAFMHAVMKAEGVTKESFNKMLSAGLDVKKYAPLMTEAFRSLVKPGLVEESAKGLFAEMNKLKNEWILLKRAFADKDFANSLTPVIIAIRDLLSAATSFFTGIGGQITILALGVAAFAALGFTVGRVTKAVGDKIIKLRQLIADEVRATAAVRGHTTATAAQAAAVSTSGVAFTRAATAAEGAALANMRFASATAGATIAGRALLTLVGGWAGLAVMAAYGVYKLVTAQSDFQDSLKETAKSVQENGKLLDDLNSQSLKLRGLELEGLRELAEAEAYRGKNGRDAGEGILAAEAKIAIAREQQIALIEQYKQAYIDAEIAQKQAKDDLTEATIRQAEAQQAVIEASLETEGTQDNILSANIKLWYATNDLADATETLAKAEEKLNEGRQGFGRALDLEAKKRYEEAKDRVKERARLIGKEEQRYAEDQKIAALPRSQQKQAMSDRAAQDAIASKEGQALIQGKAGQRSTRNPELEELVAVARREAELQFEKDNKVTASKKARTKATKELTDEEKALLEVEKQYARYSESLDEQIVKVTDELEDQAKKVAGVSEAQIEAERSAVILERQFIKEMEAVANSTMKAEDKAKALSRLSEQYNTLTAKIVQNNEALRQGQALDDLKAMTKEAQAGVEAAQKESRDLGLTDKEAQEQDAKDKRNKAVDEAAKKLVEAGSTPEAIAEYQRTIEALDKELEIKLQNINGLTMNIGAQIRNNLGQDIYDALSGNFGAIADRWKEMLKRMVAEWLASKIMDMINSIGSVATGTETTQGSGTGFLSSVGKFIGSIFSFAEGGHVQGAGTGTSDSIAAWLSDGEFVMNSKAVAKYGLDFMEAINSGSWIPKSAPRFARGGSVGRSPVGSMGGGGAGVQVNVINNTKEPAKTEQTRGTDGMDIITVIIGEVANNIAKGGAVNKSISSTFGLQRAGVIRG